jgi:hypothetical protein
VSVCQLRLANGEPGVECDEEFCIYWRLVDQIGVAEQSDWSGCAIQHFALLEGGGAIASWLLSVKIRAEVEFAGGLEPIEPPEGVRVAGYIREMIAEVENK